MLGGATLPYDKWCEVIKKNENVYLITKDEHKNWNKEKPEMINIKKRGLFDNGGRAVGFSYGEKEIKYLKSLFKDTLST